jgi:two-component system, cell cycle response regulator DivK
MGDQLQGKRILIVDDSEDMRNLMQQILEEDDYILGFAEDGQQVLQKVTEFQPDLILLDMSLPGMSGWEIVPQLRHTPNLAHIPVIAVTAHVSKADQERAIVLGCNAHLGKPFDIEMLLETITQVLENPSRDI